MLLLLTSNLQKELHTIMDKWIVSFISASFFSLLWTEIPSLFILPFLCIGGILLLSNPVWIPLSGFLFGCLWMASVGHWQLDWQLPISQLRQVNTVSGQITSLVTSQQPARFNLKINRINGQSRLTSPMIRLSWHSPNWELKQGQRVTLLVKLKPPRGLANEAGFNYQKWLFSQSFTATGYVRKGTENRLIDNHTDLRQHLFDRLHRLSLDNIRWISALSLGDRSGFTQQDWQLIQSTGVAHLVAISGLHLAIVASFAYLFFSGLVLCAGSKVRLPQQINFHAIGILFSLLTGFFYAQIAGLQLPVLRACLLLMLVTILTTTRSQWRPVQLLTACVFLIIIFFPLSILTMSFWLSFAAVTTILFLIWRWPVYQSRNPVKSYFIEAVRIQFLLSLLMLPIVALHFSFVSLSSPFVNLIAVPFVTLVVVPVCLVGSLCLILFPAVGEWILLLADALIGAGVSTLQSAESLDWAVIETNALPGYVWLFVGLFVVTTFLPLTRYFRVLSVLLIVPLISWLPQSKNNDWRVDVLDVGQGLSVLISRQNNAILFDTGASFPSGFNMAEAVILPILKSRGIKQLDKVFISHFDNDHAGGLDVLRKSIPIKQILSPKSTCYRGWQSKWEHLQIEVLWPEDPVINVGNNQSCVIRIYDDQHQVLLTGDIERSAERMIVESHESVLPSDILLVPHHGSNTSSSSVFLSAVRPKHSVFSEGFRNRWNFPSEDVVKRYLNIGSSLYSTSEHGQVSFIMQPDDKEIKIIRYRQDTYPYWYAN